MALLFDHSEMSLSFSIHHKLIRMLAKGRHLNELGKHIFSLKPMPILVMLKNENLIEKVGKKGEKHKVTKWDSLPNNLFFFFTVCSLCLMPLLMMCHLVRRTPLCNSSGRWQFSHWCFCHSLRVLTSELHKVTLTKSFRTWPCHLNQLCTWCWRSVWHLHKVRASWLIKREQRSPGSTQRLIKIIYTDSPWKTNKNSTLSGLKSNVSSVPYLTDNSYSAKIVLIKPTLLYRTEDVKQTSDSKV